MEAASVVCFALALQRAFKDRLGPRAAVSLGTTSQGVNAVVPAGGTAGFAFAAVIAVGVLTAHASLAASMVPAALAMGLLGAFAIVLTPARRARSPAAPARARAWPRGRFLHEAFGLSGDLLSDHDPWLVVGALGYVVFDLVALAAALAALGWGGLGAGTVILGYTLGQLGSVIPLPGATEGGLAGGLTLYGAPLSLAVPAVLVYRTIAIASPLVLAAVGVVQLRHGLEVTGASDATWPATT